ncbi:MAG: amidohydrolase family protein [Clostridia bacterium]|nr:amidohydrolase family protein [Clostridia bacterium]
MEKVFDVHIHYSFDIPMDEMVKIFKEEFEETGTEKYVFLSLPHHANGNKLHLSANQNVKGLFLKYAFSPDGYAFAGLIHPQSQISDEDRATTYYDQAVRYNSAGYDGIKMLEGHPTLRRSIGIALDSPVYDKFYNYLEQVGMPIIMHVADPAESWSLETASESAKALGRTYAGDFPSKRQLTDEVFGILKKHPKLKLGLAHFGFMSYDIEEAERFLSYENVFFDLTPGGEQLINMSKNWETWLAFFEKYQDRIIYGSDFYAFPKNDRTEWRTAFRRRPDFLRQFFETEGEYLYIDQTFRGVNIGKDLRNKLYRDNFMGLLGSPKPIDMDYFKSEICKLLKNPPCGKEYYTKDGVIDISAPENLKKVTERYKRDLEFMLQNLN